MPRFSRPKGTQDILPEDQPYWAHLHAVVTQIAQSYGFERIDIPIFESTELFARGVGEGTDIVDKEMYSFKDKGDRDITLRPEFTAGVMRAYIENGLHVQLAIRLSQSDRSSATRNHRPGGIASSTSSMRRSLASTVHSPIWRRCCWPGISMRSSSSRTWRSTELYGLPGMQAHLSGNDHLQAYYKNTRTPSAKTAGAESCTTPFESSTANSINASL